MLKLPMMPLPKMPTMPRMPSLAGGIGQRKQAAEEEEPVESKVAEIRTAFMQRTINEADRFKLVTDTEYWCCMCFETREQKEAFLKALGMLEEGDKYIDGRKVAASLGIDVGSKITWPKAKGLSERLKKHVG
jgi:hypothetical protein